MGAAERLKEKVVDDFDWAYIECNTDPGEPDLRDDVIELLRQVQLLSQDSGAGSE